MKKGGGNKANKTIIAVATIVGANRNKQTQMPFSSTKGITTNAKNSREGANQAREPLQLLNPNKVTTEASNTKKRRSKGTNNVVISATTIPRPRSATTVQRPHSSGRKRRKATKQVYIEFVDLIAAMTTTAVITTRCRDRKQIRNIDVTFRVKDAWHSILIAF